MDIAERYPIGGGPMARWMWVVVLAACATRRAGVDLELSLVRALDAAWASRQADLRGVDDAFEAVAAHADLPIVAWRRVRAELARAAMLEPEAAVLGFDEARRQGLACLGAGSADEGRARLRRGAPVDSACAAWTAIAWCRWSLRFGRRAAALDAPDLALLVERAGDDAHGDVARATCAAATGGDATPLVELARSPASARLEGGDDRWLLWEDVHLTGAAASWRATIDALPIPRTPEARATAARLTR